MMNRCLTNYRQPKPKRKDRSGPMHTPCYGNRLALLALVILLSGSAVCMAKSGRFADPAVLEAQTANSRGTNASKSVSTATNAAPAMLTNSMETLDDSYHLTIGDRISFRIVQDEDGPKSLYVTDSGDLELPYLGRWPAEGKTCKKLAYAIKAALEKKYYYHATVIIAVDVKAKSRGKVYLVGAVRSPGPENIPSDEVFTLSKAILCAGGFTDYANERAVKVTRKKAGADHGDETITVNVADVLKKGKVNEDLTLKPGDLIYIPDRMVRF